MVLSLDLSQVHHGDGLHEHVPDPLFIRNVHGGGPEGGTDVFGIGAPVGGSENIPGIFFRFRLRAGSGILRFRFHVLIQVEFFLLDEVVFLASGGDGDAKQRQYGYQA